MRGKAAQTLFFVIAICVLPHVANAGECPHEEIWKPTVQELSATLEKHLNWMQSGKQVGERAQLCRADLRMADLSGAKLSEANLSGARLSEANLSGANLSGANLSDSGLLGANLSEANLRGADLNKAGLWQADLSGASLSGADLSEAFLTEANLSRAGIEEANLFKAFLYKANLSRTNLNGAILSRANLGRANLGRALLEQAILKEANLNEANLSEANLSGADLSGADLSEAILSRANLSEANLSEAILSGTNISGAVLGRADLLGARFGPAAGKLPSVENIADANSLWKLKYSSPRALVDLRKLFRNAGYREQERQVTYALKHQETMTNLKGRGTGRLDGAFNYLLFDLTTAWGMKPGRAIGVLAIFIMLFTPAYWRALEKPDADGIWRVWSEERRRKDLGNDEGDGPIELHGAKAWRTALYFSVMSAFHIGWRDLNVGNWIARIQRYEFTYRATGWVRVVSGLQSLISVYLLALWALTYFGRPFQ